MDSSAYNPLRVLEEVTRRLGDLVPEDAATHFINAQKEMVLGLTALIEHRAGQQRPASRGGRRAGGTARARRPRRVHVV